MLRTLLVIAIMVPGVIAAFFNRYVALLLYVWWSLFRPDDWMWTDVSAWRISLILGLILVVPALLTGRWPSMKHPLAIGSLLFLATALVAHIGAVDRGMSWVWMDFFGRLILICLVAVTLLDTPKAIMGAVAVIAGSMGFHTAKAGLASLISGGAQFYDGYGTSAFVDNNGYALAAVMVMPLLYAVGQNAAVIFGGFVPKRLMKMAAGLWFIAAPLSGYAVVSLFSRGGFLGLMAAVMAFLAFHARHPVRLLALLGFLSLLVFTIPLPDGYLDRIQTIPLLNPASDVSDGGVEAQGDVTGGGRPHFWRVALEMVRDRPLGVGLRNYEAAYDRYDFSNGAYGQRRSVHNSHLQVLAELGYAGALVWVVMFAYAFRVALRVRKRASTPGLDVDTARLFATSAEAIIVSMVGFIVGGSFVALALNDITWLLFAVLAALDRASARACLPPVVPEIGLPQRMRHA